MLILTQQDIEYCQLIDTDSSIQKRYSAVFYKGLFFIKIKSFDNNKSQEAVKRCRQFLDRKYPITSIIVKEPDCMTLWSKATDLNLNFTIELRKINSAEQAETKQKKSLLKYRGQQTIEPSEKKSITLKENIVNRKKKLRYRGSSYVS